MTILKKIAKGSVWVLFFKLASRGIGLVSILILARLLTPADFGLVAIAMAMISALELAGNFSFDIALIQKQDATPQHYDTVWTITLIFQLSTTLVLLAAAFPIARLFAEPQLGSALIVLSIAPLLDGLQNVRIVDFRKKMMFQKDFTFLLTKRLIGFAVTIPLAFYLRNYWALVAGTICSRLGGTIVSYMLIPHSPKFGTKHWHELFSFSKWLFANNILFFLRHRAPSFIIGKLSGTSSLGVFEVSNEIASVPTTELVAPINRAVLPGLSTINDDIRELGSNYIRIVGMIILLAAPAGVGIAAVAEPLVYVALGVQWIDAIPIISVLGFVSAISCIESNTGTTCVALGRPDLVTKLNAIYVTGLLGFTIWFTWIWGISGTAWAWLLTAVINIPVYYTVMLRRMDVHVLRFLQIVWRPVLAATLMYVVVQWFLKLHPMTSGSFGLVIVLFESVAIGASVYIVAVSALWYVCRKPKGAEQEIISQVTNYVARLRGRHKTDG